MVSALAGLGCSATLDGTRGTGSDAATEASADVRMVRDAAADTHSNDVPNDSQVRDVTPDQMRDGPVADSTDGGVCRFRRSSSDAGVSVRDGAVTDSNRSDSAMCVDSDGGRNPSVRGTVTSSGESSTDRCTDSTTLAESYCTDDGRIASVSLPCTTGTTCVDGACVSSSPYSFRSLIGDYLDRTPGNRVPHIMASTTEMYSPMNPETSTDANPFSDGVGGNLGRSEVFLYRVSGSEFPPFASSFARDNVAGNMYLQSSNLWVSGDTHFDPTVGGVVARVPFVAYSMKFGGLGSSEAGVPVCTREAGGNFTSCIVPGSTLGFNYATAAHRVGVNLLGSNWLITEMNPPDRTTTNPNQVVAGGSIRLGRENRGGFLNTRFYTDERGRTQENPDYDVWDLTPGYHLYVERHEVHAGINYAIFVVVNDDCEVLRRDRIGEGETSRFSVGGVEYRLHDWKNAPGFTLGASWADLSLLSDEITLLHGERLDPDSGRFRNYQVTLGWKNNRSPGETDAHVDSLRTMVVHSDRVDGIASGGTNNLRPGESIPFVTGLGGYGLQYQGLTGGPTLIPITFELQSAARSISTSDGPVGPTGVRVGCTINAPYLQVSAGTGNPFYINFAGFDGIGSGNSNEFFVALNGAQCGSTVLGLNSIFVRDSPASSTYTGQFFVGGARSASTAVLRVAGSEVSGFAFGVPEVLGSDAFRPGGLRCASRVCADMYVQVAEVSGLGASSNFHDTLVFGVTNTRSPTGATFAFDSSTATSETITRVGQMLYGHSAPFETRYTRLDLTGPVVHGFEMIGEGYVTERGSTFNSLAATRVRIDLADALRQASFRVSELP